MRVRRAGSPAVDEGAQQFGEGARRAGGDCLCSHALDRGKGRLHQRVVVEGAARPAAPPRAQRNAPRR
eukprot:2175307-Prymnesium_polylepis.2